MRVAIGGSSYDWYGSGAGGVAYMNVFSRGDLLYQPAFVFPAQLGGGGTAKFIWEAVSHEVGHTLGLSHDGQLDRSTGRTAVEYYEGACLGSSAMPGPAGACMTV